MRVHFVPIGDSVLSLPGLKKKEAKISHLSKVLNFAPSETHFAPSIPPHKRISGANTVLSPDYHLLSSVTRDRMDTLRKMSADDDV